MGYALLFAGQGQQHPQMLAWVEREGAVFGFEEELGADWRGTMTDAGWAARNRIAQPLLTGLALAAWEQLAVQLPPPAIVAGYSVGELAAFSAAGVVDRATAIRLAHERARCMDAAAEGIESGLLAVTGTSAARIQALCMRFELDVAIRIGPGSAVLGGLRPSLIAAADAAAESGMRCTSLKIALASHTRWMLPAVEPFDRALAASALRRPTIALASNALGRVSDGPRAREALARQIAQTVRWDECLESVAAQRVEAVLEIGAGDALSRMWRERFPEIPARSADEFQTPRAIVSWIRSRITNE
ncbi:MAG TPA: acyltransferase domain-containing protein [Burkholderiaceae bacterium]|nr:acyltransferase domain-containing protein [Burkholderiaceae bacterium]